LPRFEIIWNENVGLGCDRTARDRNKNAQDEEPEFHNYDGALADA